MHPSVWASVISKEEKNKQIKQMETIRNVDIRQVMTCLIVFVQSDGWEHEISVMQLQSTPTVSCCLGGVST